MKGKVAKQIFIMCSEVENENSKFKGNKNNMHGMTLNIMSFVVVAIPMHQSVIKRVGIIITVYTGLLVAV